MLLPDTFADLESGKKRPSKIANAAGGLQVSDLFTDEAETGQEVSDLTEAVDVLLGEAAVQSPMRTKRTDARRLPSARRIIARRPWRRTSSLRIARVRLHHLVAIETASETETETLIALPHARDATTMPLTSAEIGMTGRRIDAAVIEVRMMNFPTEMNDLQALDAGARKTRMSTPAETQGTPRYGL